MCIRDRCMMFSEVFTTSSRKLNTRGYLSSLGQWPKSQALPLSASTDSLHWILYVDFYLHAFFIFFLYSLHIYSISFVLPYIYIICFLSLVMKWSLFSDHTNRVEMNSPPVEWTTNLRVVQAIPCMTAFITAWLCMCVMLVPVAAYMFAFYMLINELN